MMDGVAPARGLPLLWDQDDLLGVVVRYLQLRTLQHLPVVARSFAKAQWRLFKVVARGSGAMRACTQALLCALQDTGRECMRFSEAWDEDYCCVQGDLIGCRGTRVAETWKGTPDIYAHACRFDIVRSIVLYGCDKMPGQGIRCSLQRFGDRNCVRRLRLRLKFGLQGQTENIVSYGGVSLEHTYRVEIAALRFGMMDASGDAGDGASDGVVSLEWMCQEGGRAHSVTLLERCDLGRWYDVDVDFDWHASRAAVSVDGAVATRAARFVALPLRYVFLQNYNQGNRITEDEKLRAGASSFGPLVVDFFRASRHRAFAAPPGPDSESDSEGTWATEPDSASDREALLAAPG